jgi:hypothetical protein
MHQGMSWWQFCKPCNETDCSHIYSFFDFYCKGQVTKQECFPLTVSPIIDKTDKANQAIIETLTEFIKVKNASLTENK